MGGALSRYSGLPARLVQCFPRHNARAHFNPNKWSKQKQHSIITHTWLPTWSCSSKVYQHLNALGKCSAPTGPAKTTQHTGFIQGPLLHKGTFLLKRNLFFNIDIREVGERETETLICCSTFLCIHCLILVCALTKNWICNLGISEPCCNQLSYPARAKKTLFQDWKRQLFCLIYINKHRK